VTSEPGGDAAAGPVQEQEQQTAQEKAERSAATMWAADDASRALGMELLEVAPGRARLRMTVRPDMVQGHGTCHGGVLFSFCDSAFAFACNSAGEVTVGSSAEITWVAPAHVGDVLVADAEEEIRYGRSGVTRVRVTRESDGVLVAVFTGRSRSLGRPIS